MKNIVRYIDCTVPSMFCNLKCDYCYLKFLNIDVYNKNRKKQYLYSKDIIRRALCQKRLGGVCLFSIFGDGETLYDYEIIEIIKELLLEGHYIEIITNGTLTRRFHELMEIVPSEFFSRLKFVFSLHYLELKKRNMLSIFFNNIRMMSDAGASYHVLLNHCDEYLPYKEEISMTCMEEVGALPQIAITHRPDGKGGYEIDTKMSEQEYYYSAESYNSPMLNYLRSFFGIKQTGFCHAGEWSFRLNIGTGMAQKCYQDLNFVDIFANPDEELVFKPIGKCESPYCGCSRFLALGLIPGVCDEYTLYDVCDRPEATWIKKEFKEALETKLFEVYRK